MIATSKEANPNYLCKIVRLEGIKKLPNSDFLQTVTIDFQTVITGLDAKEGDIYVYFPVECKISKDFLSHTNSFRDKTLNQDQEKAGFFEENCRVKAMKLRGEKSMGYIVPSTEIYKWSGDIEITLNKNVGTEFDTIGNKLLVEKYVVKTRENNNIRQGKKPKVSRIIEGQVHLHTDTENLRKNAHKIQPKDIISIAYKIHGTSWWVSNVLVKKKLNWLEKLGQKLGLNVQATEYDLIYGSRKVVKNQSMDDPKAKDHFYGYDLWEDIKNKIGDKIPKGYTLYGEMAGYDKNGAAIQKGYDYGCKEGEHILRVYRITNTTPDGLVMELTDLQIIEFCSRVGLEPLHLLYYGEAAQWLADYDPKTPHDYILGDVRDFQEEFVKRLEQDYNEKDCFMCVNKVPEEGVVIRKESLFEFEAYKLKSFRFLEWESKELDNGTSDIESEN